MALEDIVRSLLEQLDHIGWDNSNNPIMHMECSDILAWHVDELRDCVQPTPKKKYTLLVKMYTDHDAMIECMDHLYCYYRSSLDIFEDFDDLNEIVYFIKEHISVHDGYKASGMAKKWLADCVASIESTGIPASDSSGNQEYSMRIITN